MAIVIADDDPAMRGLVRRALARLGYDCKEAGGAEALAKACARRPQAVVSDIGLKDGDGIEACLALRWLYPGLPVVIMTGDADEAARALGAGFLEVLKKPFTLAELGAALRRALSRARKRRPSQGGKGWV